MHAAIFDESGFFEARTLAELAAHDFHHSHTFSERALAVERAGGVLAWMDESGAVTASVVAGSTASEDVIRAGLRRAGFSPEGATIIRQSGDPRREDGVYALEGDTGSLPPQPKTGVIFATPCTSEAD